MIVRGGHWRCAGWDGSLLVLRLAFLSQSDRASASVKAFDQEGVSPSQANVTGLNPTLVTASS